MTIVRSGDSEAVTGYGIGLAKRETFKVFTCATQWPRHRYQGRIPDRQRVWLLNPKRYLANTEPFFTPVLQPFTPATGIMDRIFAGPLPIEYARGLRGGCPRRPASPTCGFPAEWRASN
jgi:hypothetical protein